MTHQPEPSGKPARGPGHPATLAYQGELARAYYHAGHLGDGPAEVNLALGWPETEGLSIVGVAP